MKTPMRTMLFAVLALILLGMAPSPARAQWFSSERTEKRYQQCVDLYDNQQFAEARECIREFIASYPNSRWVEHLQFLDASMETNVVEAEAKLQQFVREYPTGPYSAQANFSLGEICELRGDYGSAEKYYSQVNLYFWTSEHRDEAGLRMAKCMLMRGDTAAAIRHLDIYLATHSDRSWHQRARELRADALYQAGDHLAARQEYKEAISEAESPHEASPHCYIRIAQTYEDSGDHNTAALAYRRFLDLFPAAPQTADVEKKLQMLTAQEEKKKTTSTNGSYTIETDVFESEQQAVGFVAQLRRLGYRPYIVTRDLGETTSFAVRLGPYESRDAALTVRSRLEREAGIESTLLPQAAQY